MSKIVDLLSIVSVVGIWPRYIEPHILKITHLDWKLPKEASHLEGLTCVQLSDLHFHSQMSDAFLDKIVRRVMRQKPDLIFFTGDFICHAKLPQPDRLKKFLSRLQAPQGCFCIFGNHDYQSYVSLNSEGVFDSLPPPNPVKGMIRGLRALFLPKRTRYAVSAKAQALPPHEGLMQLLADTPFTLLENSTMTLSIGLNITGLGDHALNRCRPETAFAGYQKKFPGIILSHNPDTFKQLCDYPGDWVLSGHTHGEQIHLPFCRPLSRKLARLQNGPYSRGLFEERGKKLYVTRGVGSPKPFRFCSPPEIVVLKGVCA